MKICTYIVLLLSSLGAAAQQVPKQVLAEHFTNTYCSVCANNNPGLYNNLFSFSGVLHIAYYPSAPYAACPLSQQNVAEQDARTNYYGIYGATPRLVVQGNVLPPTNYTDPNIYQSQLGQTASFYMQADVSSVADTAIMVRMVIRKVDTSSIDSLLLYGAIAEDTLFFAANNGETVQYDVFRHSIFGAQPMRIAAPVNIGDSLVYTRNISLGGVQDIHRAYALVMAQQTDNTMVQAARSANLQPAMSVPGIASNKAISIYPNPAGAYLYIDAATYPVNGTIINISGQVMKQFNVAERYEPVDVSGLKAGVYFIKHRENAFKYVELLKQ
jgi:hypothetical protein